MSTLKIERDTVRKGSETVANAAAAAAAVKDGPLPGTSGKHPHLEKIGTAITGGKGNAGTKGYLMVRILCLIPTAPRPRAISSAHRQLTTT
jgi:hypothetical protein